MAEYMDELTDECVMLQILELTPAYYHKRSFVFFGTFPLKYLYQYKI